MNNKHRALRANKALEVYIGTDDLEPQDAIKDIICDLCHLAHLSGFDYLELLKDGEDSFIFELGNNNEECNKT